MCLFKSAVVALINCVFISTQIFASAAACASCASPVPAACTPSGDYAPKALTDKDTQTLLKKLPSPDTARATLTKFGVVLPEKSSDSPPSEHSAECYVWLFDRGGLCPALLGVLTRYAGNSPRKTDADHAVMHTLVMGKAPDHYTDTHALIPRLLALRDIFYLAYPPFLSDQFTQACLTPARPTTYLMKSMGHVTRTPAYQSRVVLYATPEDFPEGKEPEGIFAGLIAFIPRQIPNPFSAVEQPRPPSDPVKDVLCAFSRAHPHNGSGDLTRMDFSPD